jgi:tRNA modification GTPase
VSALTEAGLGELKRGLVAQAAAAMPKAGETALNLRQRRLLADAVEGLRSAAQESDLLLIGEGLRQCRNAFDRLVGRSGTEDVLDALFGRFCIGK